MRMTASTIRPIVHALLIEADGERVTIDAIYRAVEATGKLNDSDRERSTLGNKQAAWKRNVRNVLQRDRSKLLILGGMKEGGYMASAELLDSADGERVTIVEVCSEYPPDSHDCHEAFFVIDNEGRRHDFASECDAEYFAQEQNDSAGGAA